MACSSCERGASGGANGAVVRWRWRDCVAPDALILRGSAPTSASMAALVRLRLGGEGQSQPALGRPQNWGQRGDEKWKHILSNEVRVGKDPPTSSEAALQELTARDRYNLFNLRLARARALDKIHVHANPDVPGVWPVMLDLSTSLIEPALDLVRVGRARMKSCACRASRLPDNDEL